MTPDEIQKLSNRCIDELYSKGVSTSKYVERLFDALTDSDDCGEILEEAWKHTGEMLVADLAEDLYPFSDEGYADREGEFPESDTERAQFMRVMMADPDAGFADAACAVHAVELVSSASDRSAWMIVLSTPSGQGGMSCSLFGLVKDLDTLEDELNDAGCFNIKQMADDDALLEYWRS